MKNIILTKGKKAIVDDNVFKSIGHLPWYAQKLGNAFYAVRHVRVENNRRTVLWLHHCVVGFPLWGKEIDHIDGDSLNNLRSNLRYVTRRENAQNKKCHREGRLVGVDKCEESRNFRARIGINGRTVYLGCFPTKEEANIAYQKALYDINDRRIVLMQTLEEQKIQKLLDLLDEQDVILKRMMLTCEQLEKELRGRLNDGYPPAA
jgi:hypothetical protein